MVDDEHTVRQVVAAYLERDGFVVSEAADGLAALAEARSTQPDLVVLDVMIPRVDGLDVLKDLRRSGDVPVILLTARADEADRVVGLELGADDYVVKPFSPRELVARARTVLRRARPAPVRERIEYDGITIDGATREVCVDERVIDLTPREFDLLAFLAASPRQVFSRSQILEQVWDSSAEFQDPSTVTVHVRRLRRKIERDAARPRWLLTVWGVGYRFEP